MARFTDVFADLSPVVERIPDRADHGQDDSDPWLTLVRAVWNDVESRKRESAIKVLREEGLLSPNSLADADPAELTEALRLRNVSIADRAPLRLKRVAHWLVKRHGGEVAALATIDTDTLREELSKTKGVGLSLADAILLFGLRRGIARFDRGSFRVFARHGWIDPDAEPDDFRALLEDALDSDSNRLADWSLKLDAIAREFCRPAVAKCEQCPLRPFLPESGPLYIEDDLYY